MWDLLSQPFCQRIVLALVHFIWQGTAIAVVLATILTVFSVRQARVRYLLSLSAMLLMGLCLPVTFLLSSAETPVVTSTPSVASLPMGMASPAPRVARTLPAPATTAPVSWTHVMELIRAEQPLLMLAWMVGVSLLASRLVLGYATTLWLRGDRRPLPPQLNARMAALGRRLGIRTAGRVFASARVRVATATGFWRPIVLLPLCWLTELPPAAIEAVVAHELAHIRRWDLWVTLVQRVLETVLFYHPAVWWTSRRLELEREMCCDELAVAATGERLVYVQALAQAARTPMKSSHVVLAASFNGEGKMHLLNRVRYVLGSHPTREGGRWWPVGVLVLALPMAIWSLSSGVPGGLASANADEEREGAREGAREDGQRASPEAREGGRREGAREGDEGARREGAREGDEGARREGAREGEEGARREGAREGAREGEPRVKYPPRKAEGADELEGFKPLTVREAQLMKKIKMLEAELQRLRGDGEGEAAGKMKKPAVRDGERATKPGARDGEGDGVRKGPRDGEGAGKPGPRDGEGEGAKGPRDGEGAPRTGPRDGEGGAKPGPRDGE